MAYAAMASVGKRASSSTAAACGSIRASASLRTVLPDLVVTMHRGSLHCLSQRELDSLPSGAVTPSETLVPAGRGAARDARRARDRDRSASTNGSTIP